MYQNVPIKIIVLNNKGAYQKTVFKCMYKKEEIRKQYKF